MRQSAPWRERRTLGLAHESTQRFAIYEPVVVQDRYAGDVGDFLKYGLLRALCARGGVERLGVVWYLADDESHNSDGRHVSYLRDGNRRADQLRGCDPELYLAMRNVVDAPMRLVATVEASGALPPSCVYFSRRLTRGTSRAAWLSDALAATRTCDAVFLDPDNGITFAPGRRPEKYASIEEVAAFVDRGQSAVVYHHCDRSASVETQAQRMIERAGAALPTRPFAAVLARRGTVRMFLVIAQPAHEPGFRRVLSELSAGPWGHHLTPVYERPQR